MADLPESLIRYLANRDAQRANAVAAFLASLTDRERGLFHDAAVMGFVQGLMRDREDGCPKDSQVMALVIGECFGFPDQYPTVNTLADRGEQQAAAPTAPVHACPGPDDNGISPCCGRRPYDFRSEHLTRDPDKVTCKGARP